MEGTILYVGEASEQDLRTRIKQNFTRGNKGGTFRNNWCKTEKSSFAEFRKKLCTYRILVVSTTMENAIWISSFERDMIALYNPKYNKKKYVIPSSFRLDRGGTEGGDGAE